jgi:hypothetical protein
MVDDAIEFMLDEIGGLRLVIVHPPEGSGRRGPEAQRKKRRYQALLSYYDRVDLGASSTEAAEEVAVEYAVTERTVWGWVKSIQG